MDTLRITMLALIVLMCASCARQTGGELADFEWMIGDWVAQDGAISEHWHAVSGKTFEGKGITTSKDKISTESLRLADMEGEIFFIAKVAHNDVPVAFRLTGDSTPGHSVFANPTHDFPKQIVYDKDGANSMTVTVSDGDTKGFQLHFTRR